MKYSVTFLVLLTVAVVTADSASAQDTKIGNGRLLRKWRDDIFGSSDSKKEQPPANGQHSAQQNLNARNRAHENAQGQPQAAQNQRTRNGFRSPAGNENRQPTLASPRPNVGQSANPDPRIEAQRRLQLQQQYEAQRLNAMNPSGQQLPQRPQSDQPSPDYYRQRTPGNQPVNNLARNTPNNPQRQNAQRQPAPAQRYQPESVPDRHPEYLQNSAAAMPESYPVSPSNAQAKATQNAKKRGPRAIGFGMELKADKEDQIYVADVDRNGNAATAGLKKGDIILEIGGSKLMSVEEFDEISKVMNDGDQLELKVDRRGRVADVRIQFGEAEDVPDMEVEDDAEAGFKPQRRPQSQPVPQRSQDSRFDFVPDSKRDGGSGIVVNPGLLDKPSPPRSVEAPSIRSLEIDLDAQLPTRGNHSVLEPGKR